MKKNFCFVVIILFSTIAIFGQNSEQPNQIILQLKHEITNPNKSLFKQIIIGNSKIDSINKKYHALKIKKQTTGRKSNKFIYIIQFPPGTDIDRVMNEYYSTREIEYIEPDHCGSGGGKMGVIPNDQYYERQWGLKNDGSFPLSPSIAGADIDIENAWNIEQGDSSVIVGIIDSGNKLDHPEFDNRIWRNYSEIPNNGIDDDSNGFIDDTQGWDFANSDNNPTDDLGHGTNVTGIIGANGNNTIGHAGVDWNCKLMILKGIDINNFGYYSWWADAIYYAVDNGANVISMSIGGTGTSTTLQNAVAYALDNNVAVVACMMNSNSNTVYYPAGFPDVIAVGSTDSDDTRSNPFFWDPASGSNYGDHISVVAPGNYIYGLDHLSNTNYDSYWSGTSQATPHVSGLASLLLAQNPSRTPSQIRSIIELTAEDQVGDPSEDIQGRDQYYGNGRINASTAISLYADIEVSNSKHQKLILYPNPTKDNFTVIVPPDTQQIRIYSSIGRLILTENIERNSLNKFYLVNNGIYYIQITTDKQIITNKLIVSK